MYVYKFGRIIVKLLFLVKFIFWKFIYGTSFSFPFFFNSCIDSGASIRNIKGRIVFKGKFVSRRNLSINVTNGTLTIGRNVFFNQSVSINCQGCISIGDNCIVGEDVKFYDHNHKFALNRLIKDQGFSIKEIFIGSNVWLGSNVIILSGVSIGDNCVISAGSIIRENIPSNMIFKDGELITITKRR